MLESVKKAFHWVFKDLIEELIVATIDTFRQELTAVAAQVAQLATDVNTKLGADAAALAAAEANAVQQSDVDAVTAVGAQVTALDAVVNPQPAAPVTEPSS